VSELGHPRIHLRCTDSTNSRARELAGAGAPSGTLISADEQTAGRGRQGRRWSAPARSSLLCSILLREPPALLPLLGAVAVCDILGADVHIKWPNDIVLRRDQRLAKLGGILAEGRPQEGWAVLGIGLNVAVRLEQLPVDLRQSAATLGGTQEQIEPTLGHLLSSLQRRLAGSEESLLAAWRERDALYGHEVAWAQGKGRAQGIDASGRLIVNRVDGARVTLEAGEVHLAYSPA
jgi:BirA family biotin operon repressor/biotin-[acetyl-CoA-carboxylase] ligase